MRLPFAALALATLTLASSAFADDKKPAKPPVTAAPAGKDTKDAEKAKDPKHHKAHKKHGPTAKLDHKTNVAKKDDVTKVASAHKKGDKKIDPKAATKTEAKVDPKAAAKTDSKKLEPKAEPKADKKDGDEPPEELTGALPQKKLADKKKAEKADGKADKKDEIKKEKDKEEPKKILLPHGGKVSATDTSVEFHKLQKKTITADKKGKMKACLNPAVTFARLGQPTDISFALTTCNGGAAPGAVDNLSILARPYDVPAPSAPFAPTKALAVAKKAKPSKDLAMPHDEIAPGIRRVDPGLVSRIQSIANHFPGKTITLVSGYRPASKGSPHQAARAMDIRIDGVTNEALVAFCKTLQDTGCGYYPNSYFVHVDVRAAGAGHVYWIDVSGPGEKPSYVKQWPLPEKAKPADMVKGESKMASKAPSESEIAGAAPTTDVKEIGALEEAEEEPASSGSPTN